MTKILTVILSLLPILTFAQANQFSNPAASRAFADVFSVDNAAFTRDIQKVTDKAQAAFLKEYMALMNYTAANSKENYDAFFDASDNAFDAAYGSKYEDNLLCQLHIHKCMVYIYDGSLLSAGIQFWKSYNAFKIAEKKYPTYEGQLPLRGLYNILFAQIPEKWKSLKGLLGLGEGDTALGLRQLEEYRQKVATVSGVGDEAVLFSFANMFFSHEQVLPEPILAAIRANDAPVIRYAYVLSCGRQQDGMTAVAALDSTPQAAFERFPLLYHQKGKYALKQLNPDETIKWATRFLSIYKGVSNRNWAYLEMAYAYILKGDRLKARDMIAQCQATPSDFDIDIRAREESKLAMGMSINMLRARFNFEFGNFAQSLAILKTFTPSVAESAEYFFRMARAEDKLSHLDVALLFYDQAIAFSSSSKRYFGPYAAVHAADIYIKQGRKKRAADYLVKARKLNNGEYKKELDQRIELAERKLK